MTKKRFTLKPYDGIRCDVFDGEIEIAEVHRDDAKGLINLLNNLSDENEQLRKDCTTLIYHNQEYRKENQELSNIISAIEKGSCRSIDSFLDDYCTDGILKEFDLE